MKNLLFLPVFLTAFCFGGHAQAFLGYYDYSTFYAPINGPYLETYFAAYTPSLALKQEDGQYRTGAEITIIIKEGGDIVNFDKFDMVSGLFEDSASFDFNLLGQRRLALANGTYSMEVTMKDLNEPDHLLVFPAKTILIDYPTEKVVLSDIEFIEEYQIAKEGDAFVKNGLHLVPYPMGFYPTSMEEINFYLEAYHLEKEHLDEGLVVFYSIRMEGEDRPLKNFQGFQKIQGQKVNPVLGSINVQNLPSGNYELAVELRDRENNLLTAQTALFQRSNKKAISDLDNISMLNVDETFVSEFTPEELSFHLHSLYPISTDIEVKVIDIILAREDTEIARKFLYNFWLDRDLVNPGKAWRQYKQQVDYVEKNYKTLNRHGYATDRGRVYLQYGPPNDIYRAPYENSSRPYELWQYNRIESETNLKFVFFNDDMISNHYQLIHSNKRGELRNDRWKLIVTGEDNRPLDDTEPGRDMGSGMPDPLRK